MSEKKQRRHFDAARKVAIVRRHLVDRVPVADLCDDHGLQPIVKVAKMLKRHLDNILSYFRHRITNAMNEGFNSRIQSIKSQA